MSVANLLIPVRKHIELAGTFAWSDRPILASVRTADLLPLQQLADDLRKSMHKRARIVRDATSPADVRIRRDSAIKGAEDYRLTIARTGVEILASTDVGAYYGVQTLRDLVALSNGPLHCCRIEDSPDFARRGAYEDCSRGKVPTLDTLKALVERLAHWKINEFQIYVENVFTFRTHPAIGRGYSPFTPADILEIQDFCKLHHVNFVGSLSSFGHMDKILKLKQYRHLAELPGFKGHRGGMTLCATDRRSTALVRDLYREFVPLFEAEDFNVCCDETWELGKGRSKARADKVGAARLYLEFLLKVHKLCKEHGKRMNAWADIILNHPELLPEVPKDIVMLNWGYSANSPRIAQTKLLQRAEVPFMVCPGTGGWQSHGTTLANSIANVTNFTKMGRKCGAEGVLNTDWGDHGHRNFLGVAMHGFAHGAAHSWNGRAVDDKRFTDRFCRLVLGQKDQRLSRSIHMLGQASVISGGGHPCRSSLYHTLVEPLTRPQRQTDGESMIHRTDPAGLKKVISQLSSPSIWPDLPRSADRFEKVMLKEYAMAAQMDCIAARRALAGLAIRAGRKIPPTELRALAADMRKMAHQFKTLWLTRNRPSRLADNLRLFENARKDCLQAAKR